jgi:CheY-like chemotaxis protein
MVQLLRASVSHGLGLELRLAGGLPPLRADPSQLKQVVMNLVINAAEAMGDGGGTVTVATRVEQVGRGRLAAAVLGDGLAEGRYLVLEVTDTGCGMDPATQRRIFEPFFTSKFAGRGLGLSAVLGIVRQAGGAIELTSAPGRGSRFGVLFPAADEAVAGAAAGPAAAAWHGSGLVLVVDDEPMVRRAAGRLLRRLGFEVVEAPGGAEAIALFRQRPGQFRAVVLDLTMPDLDGVETLRALRGLEPGARVVVASGHGQEAALARFQEERPDAFVQKPFALEELREGLRAVLERP